MIRIKKTIDLLLFVSLVFPFVCYLNCNQLKQTPPSVHKRGEQSNVPDKKLDSIRNTPEINEPETISRADLKILRKYGMASDDSMPIIYPSIGKLKACRQLNLSGCGIKELPPEIGELNKLENLNLTGNHLTDLPEQITKLGYLELYIEYNELSKATLSAKIVKWLNDNDSCWPYSQKGVSCNYDNDKDTAEYTVDNHIVIFQMKESSLRFQTSNGPPAGYYFVLFAKDSLRILDTIHINARHESKPNRCSPSEEFYRIIYADWKPGMLLFIRGIPGLKAGPVRTWYVNPQWMDGKIDVYSELNKDRNGTKDLELDGIGTFTLSGGFTTGCKNYLQWHVRIGDEAWRSMPTLPNSPFDLGLASADECLVWVGDLDSDGLPDLILNPTIDDYDAEYFQLFLSSQYKTGAIWNAAADFFYQDPDAGCH